MRSRNSTQAWLTAGLAGLVAGLFSWAAAAFDIYQLPMFSSGTVTPNVMLLVDTSGSMNNIIWHEDFDPAVEYPDWSSDWSPGDGNVELYQLSNSGCSGGRYRGIKSGTTKCLHLPDPVGGENTRYDGNYLNYLFETYSHNADLRGGVIPDESRMQVAKQVATNLVNTVTGVRFGVSEFYGPSSYNYGHGGTVLEDCEDTSPSHLGNLTSDINSMSAESNTPLAEAYYELTRYFRGLSSYYHSGTSYTSPVQYRCQDNYIIAITDGYPTYDTTFPSNDPADTADGTRSLPDWDNMAPPTSASDYPIFPQYSDGFQTGSESQEGYSLYLDDIAKFAFDLDIFSTGLDAEGEPWGSLSDPPPDPDEPDFRQQNILTYTVGFATANQMLEDAAEYGGGQFFIANNAAELTAALQEAVLDIQAKASSAASVALNSTRLDTNLLIYQASFDGTDWSGDLQAYDVNDTTGAVGSKVWSANEKIPPTGRNIVSQNSSSRDGIAFEWDSLSTAQQDSLGTASAWVDPPFCGFVSCTGPWGGWAQANCSKCGVVGVSNGEDILNYLRGDPSLEQKNGGDFRDRSTVLGDIVNSDPMFVGTPNYGYHVLPGTEGSSYLSFRASSAYKNRPPMVYVGANDGMLHAIEGTETGATAGVERFAYIPLAVFPNLKRLADPDYIHRFYVDGSPQAGDAYIDTGSGDAWHTVLVGTLGAGGRGVFALDVTDPTSFDSSKVLWDLAVTGDADINVTDDADLGYTYGQASIARMANGQWAAVFGNGLNSDNHRAVLFIVNLETGALIEKIDTGVGDSGTQNGLSTPVIVDVDNDKITDYIYAGDMQGNLWKFDVTGTGAGSWDVAYKLFTATAPDGTAQPITAKPTVTRRPDGDLMVFFGTGKYFEEVDRRVVESPPPQVQTFYGVRDPGAAISGGRATLAEQSVITTVNDFGFELRVTTANEPTSTQNGWYLDLPTPGERQVSRPILSRGRIIFTTVIPNSDACNAGGDSWLMELDALTGGRLAFTPFDLDGDGEFTTADYVTVTIDGEPVDVPVSGKKSKVGVIKTPGIVQAGGLEHKYTSGSTGGIEVTLEPGDIGAGRQSWRQLQ
ncbi:MAG: PilC/PilY family type IV pilus protein [Immundisolibacter sp.]